MRWFDVCVKMIWLLSSTRHIYCRSGCHCVCADFLKDAKQNRFVAARQLGAYTFDFQEPIAVPRMGSHHDNQLVEVLPMV